MGTFDRSKKKIQLWKKAIIHFSLCFVMGFFTGFAPTSTTSLFSGGQGVVSYRPIKKWGDVPDPIEAGQEKAAAELGTLNRSLMAENLTTAAPDPALTRAGSAAPPPGLLIVITTTRSGDRFKRAFLRRLAHTLRLVPPPLLWIVVEAHGDAPKTAAMLRRTGTIYRHLTFKENFTDPQAEADHQRNVALNHIEYHRLTGIVHFAGLSNVYDLRFFQELRGIEVLGTWPVAMVSANRKRVVVEGPMCSSSKVVGWLSKDLSNGTTETGSSRIDGEEDEGITDAKPPKINISGFAFNSSILWDPERWGRPTSVPDTSQDSIKFVQQVVLEDEAKMKGIPPDCSQIMLWHLHIPRVSPLPFHQTLNRR